MSSKKLNTSGSKNTLFNYFAKSPMVQKKTLDEASKTKDVCQDELEKENVENKVDIKMVAQQNAHAKRKLEHDFKEIEEDQQDDIIVSSKKRRRIIVSDESDEDEKTNDEFNELLINKASKASRESLEPSDKKIKLENTDNALAQKIQTLTEREENNKNVSKIEAKVEKAVNSASTLDESVVWQHQKLDFLKPENIKDKDGRRPNDPAYDPTTLFVPKSFLDTLTPGVRQWWILKADHFDCVLFFKVGKFYEFYHMDADIGVNELGFTYMRGEFAHSGFPEISFDKMASVLIDRGYKVARVEQTETVDMMTERCKTTKVTKFDKVVRREICQISNKGTQVFGSQCQITPQHQPNYLLSITEQNDCGSLSYGVCYVDTSIGDFYIGQFDDDKNRSRLLTLLSHHMPVLIVSEKTCLSEQTHQIFRTSAGNVLKEYLRSSGTQLRSAENTLEYLAKEYYAKSDDDQWPLVLRTMQDDSDHLGLTPKNEYKLALKALGQCIIYLKKCYLEEKIMPMARFNFYTPPDLLSIKNKNLHAESPVNHVQQQRSHMVLDSTTLQNLRINFEDHSLLSSLDTCCTKFGKRLLHYWLCSPSCDVAVIRERQGAISELIENAHILQEVRSLLAPLPDFERHLAQIHLFGNKKIVDNHPDGRAILFEEKQYNKKKIQNFVVILRGFESLLQLPKLFNAFNSPLIKRLTQFPSDGGVFPDLEEQLTFFKNAFNQNEAMKTGVIAPTEGIDVEYDAIQTNIAEINEALKLNLIEQEKHFGCRLNYYGDDKKRYQIEVPESRAKKANADYRLEGSRKGFKRFTTSMTQNFLKQMQNAEQERNNVIKDLSRRVFEKFSNKFNLWKLCVECIANLDVLACLAEYATKQKVICIPECVILLQGETPFIDIEEGYHPCVPSDSYVTNGITLGQNAKPNLSILTGPNMGGKSTLMRQIGLLVIMAQIGGHVPAKSCRLSIVDRIFTRLGAQDDILAGQSTFLVELNETSLILKHATSHSLVLLDELGRGTATYDGTAIAASVVNFLADLKCRTLFSTHYHNLIEFFEKDKRITLGHMACVVENDDTDDPTQETVTFLYKYVAGACPKSYGFNAAKLSGMPSIIIKRAFELSKKVEGIALKRKIAKKLISAAGSSTEGSHNEKNIAIIKNLINKLRLTHI